MKCTYVFKYKKKHNKTTLFFLLRFDLIGSKTAEQCGKAEEDCWT